MKRYLLAFFIFIAVSATVDDLLAQVNPNWKIGYPVSFEFSGATVINQSAYGSKRIAYSENRKFETPSGDTQASQSASTSSTTIDLQYDSVSSFHELTSPFASRDFQYRCGLTILFDSTYANISIISGNQTSLQKVNEGGGPRGIYSQSSLHSWQLRGIFPYRIVAGPTRHLLVSLSGANLKRNLSLISYFDKGARIVPYQPQLSDSSMNWGGDSLQLSDSALLYLDIPITLASGVESTNQPSSEHRIFPNPASNKLTIATDKGDGINSIHISSLNGESVLDETPSRSANRVEVNTSNLPSGAYLLQVNADEPRLIVVRH